MQSLKLDGWVWREGGVRVLCVPCGARDVAALEGPLPTINISREDTEIGQERTWLQQPRRADGGAVEIGGAGALPAVLRRSAVVHRWFRLRAAGECGWVRERAPTWESS